MFEFQKMDDKFCLKWNDFQSSLSRTFKQLRHEEDFYDVTLVSEDLSQIQAHKLVLSSCSEYFSNILKHNKHSNPLLCFETLSTKDIEHVLDYIYNGEVQVAHNNLDRFLDIAKNFKLEGLNTAREDGKAHDIYEEEIEEIEESVQTPHLKQEQSSWVDFLKKETQVISTVSNKGTVIMNLDRFNSLEELDLEIRKHTTKRDEDGKWECNICGKISRSKPHSLEHIETHFKGLEFPCNLCNATFKGRSNLRCHKWRSHRGEK